MTIFQRLDLCRAQFDWVAHIMLAIYIIAMIGIIIIILKVIHISTLWHTCSCFLSHPGAFWGAFLAPIIAILIFNFVVFIWVIVILIRHTRGTAARTKEAVSKKTIIRLMISITGVMFLFGLSWLFAVLTISVTGLRQIFQILFVIFNSFQGFFIFLFFCIFNKEAIESWREFFTCGRYKSKLLHPSQAKYSSGTGTGTGKQKQIKTFSTGFGSSTGGKNTTVVSKSEYESTAPLKTKEDLESPEHEKMSSHVNGNTGVREEEETPKKQADQKDKKKKTLSLKTRIKRYSTKKVSKHHVEEIEMDFNSDDSAASSDGEELTDNV